MDWLNRMVVRLEGLVRLVVIGAMIFMVATVLLDVVARNSSIRVRGLDEIARFSLVWIVFLVTAVGARYGDLIGMDSLANALPPGVRTVIWVIRRLFLLTFLSLFGWYALELVQMMIQTRRTSPNLHIPLWFVYAPMLVGTALMFLSLLVDLGVRIGRRDFNTDTTSPDRSAPWN